MKRSRVAVASALVVLGVVGALSGAWMVSTPVGLVVSGLLLALVGLVLVDVGDGS